MPIYAYRCDACGHAKDVLQRVSDALLTTCPACGAQAFKKQVTAAGFQLKGSGWYVTDFKGNGQQKSASDDKGGGAKADSASSEKTEAKTADGGGGKSSEAAAPVPPAKADKTADKPAPKPADKPAAKPADKPPSSAGSGSTPP
jgi:putative FmdB family regulatory protein